MHVLIVEYNFSTYLYNDVTCRYVCVQDECVTAMCVQAICVFNGADEAMITHPILSCLPPSLPGPDTTNTHTHTHYISTK